MAREYDHLFKLLIIGDSGKYRPHKYISIYLIFNWNSFFLSPSSAASRIHRTILLDYLIRVDWEVCMAPICKHFALMDFD